MVKIQSFKVKGDPYEHIMEIIDILGAKRQGSGAYATTYRVSTKEVIKVFSDDRGYEHYMKKIAKMQDNSFVPRINYIHKYVGSYSRCEYYMVSMELLRPYTVLTKKEQNKFHNFRDLVKEYVGDDWDPECLTVRDLPKEWLPVALPESLLQVMDVIEEGIHHGLGFDLHDGNFMIRDGMDIVITDPLVY